MTIVINLQKAKEIKKDMVRAERAPILAQLDVEFLKAVEIGDTTKIQEISAKKQALRDVTTDPDILEATSVEALKLADPISKVI